MKGNDCFNYEESVWKRNKDNMTNGRCEEWTMGIGEVMRFETINNFINAKSEICIEDPNDLSFGEDDTYSNNNNMNYRIKVDAMLCGEHGELSGKTGMIEQERNTSNELGSVEKDKEKIEERLLAIENQALVMDKKQIAPGKEETTIETTKTEIVQVKKNDNDMKINNNSNDSKKDNKDIDSEKRIINEMKTIIDIETQKKIDELTERIEKTEKKYIKQNKSNKNLLEEINLFKALQDININNQSNINNTNTNTISNPNSTLKRIKSQEDIHKQSTTFQNQHQNNPKTIKRIKSDEKIKVFTKSSSNINIHRHQSNPKQKTSSQVEKNKKLFIDFIQTNNKSYSKLHNNNTYNNKENQKTPINSDTNHYALPITSSQSKYSNTTNHIYTKSNHHTLPKSTNKINKNSYLNHIQEPTNVIQLNKSQMYLQYQSSENNNKHYNNTNSYKSNKNSFCLEHHPARKEFETLGLTNCLSSYVSTKPGNKITSSPNTIDHSNHNHNNYPIAQGKWNEDPYWNVKEVRTSSERNHSQHANNNNSKFKYVDFEQFQVIFKDNHVNDNISSASNNSQQSLPQKIQSSSMTSTMASNSMINSKNDHQRNSNRNKPNANDNPDPDIKDKDKNKEDKQIEIIPFYLLSSKDLMINALNSIYEKPKKLHVIYPIKRPPPAKKTQSQTTWLK